MGRNGAKKIQGGRHREGDGGKKGHTGRETEVDRRKQTEGET